MKAPTPIYTELELESLEFVKAYEEYCLDENITPDDFEVMISFTLHKISFYKSELESRRNKSSRSGTRTKKKMPIVERFLNEHIYGKYADFWTWCTEDLKLEEEDVPSLTTFKKCRQSKFRPTKNK